MKHRLVEEPLGPPTEERKNCVGNSFGEEMFAEMKLGTKLACAFGLLVVLAALTGGVAIERLSAVNHAADTLAKTWLPSIKLLGDIRNTANAFRRLENRHLVAGSSKEMDELEAMMADSRKYMAELQKKYEAFVDDNVEKAAYNEMQQRLDAYWATSVNFVALSRRNSEDSAGEAKAYMRGASNSAFQALLDTQARLVAINEKGADEAHDSAEATYNSARLMLLALIAGAFLVSVVCAVLIIRTVSRQLGGEPAYAAGVAKRIADGDLSVNVNIKPNDKSSMLAAMRDMEQQLTSIVRGIKGSSDTIASAAQQIAAGNADLSQRTEQQASSLEETASSMEELTGTVKQNAENARQANQLAAGASNVAVKGGEVVNQVVSTMSSINESSKKIADIIGVIDGIAFQTNILALNAAVEAARAGEQGRGFAVVASEVRTLAQRSAAAAKEIKTLITDSVNKVGQGTRLVDEAGKTMGEIVSSVKRVTDIMAEIAAASEEQTSGIEQVNQAIVQMDQVTQQNAALVEEAAAAAESMQQQSQHLIKAVSTFKLNAAETAVSHLHTGHQVEHPLVAHGKATGKTEEKWDGAKERRGLDRAKNVARLPQPKPAPKHIKAAAAHDDNDWQEF